MKQLRANKTLKTVVIAGVICLLLLTEMGLGIVRWFTVEVNGRRIEATVVAKGENQKLTYHFQTPIPNGQWQDVVVSEQVQPGLFERTKVGDNIKIWYPIAHPEQATVDLTRRHFWLDAGGLAAFLVIALVGWLFERYRPRSA